jgi:hypothetical protein
MPMVRYTIDFGDYRVEPTDIAIRYCIPNMSRRMIYSYITEIQCSNDAETWIPIYAIHPQHMLQYFDKTAMFKVVMNTRKPCEFTIPITKVNPISGRRAEAQQQLIVGMPLNSGTSSSMYRYISLVVKEIQTSIPKVLYSDIHYRQIIPLSGIEIFGRYSLDSEKNMNVSSDEFSRFYSDFIRTFDSANASKAIQQPKYEVYMNMLLNAFSEFIIEADSYRQKQNDVAETTEEIIISSPEEQPEQSIEEQNESPEESTETSSPTFFDKKKSNLRSVVVAGGDKKKKRERVRVHGQTDEYNNLN